MYVYAYSNKIRVLTFFLVGIYFENVSFSEASYSGGGNITFKGNLDDKVDFTARLFQGDLLLGDLPLHFTYSVSYLFCAVWSWNYFLLLLFQCDIFLSRANVNCMHMLVFHCMHNQFLKIWDGLKLV